MASTITLDNDGNNATATTVAALATRNTTTPVVVYNATGGTVTVRVTSASTDVTLTPAEVKINGGKSAVVNAVNGSTTTDHSVAVAAGDAFTTHRTSAAVGLGRNILYIG